MKDIREDINRIFQSKTASKILIGLGVLIIAGIIFVAGETVGYRKAQFAYTFGENYNRMFGHHDGPMGGLPLPPPDDFLSNTHGAVGKIVKIALPSIVIEDDDGVEKAVVIQNTSILKELRNDVSSSTLKVGDSIIVFGTPDAEGQIDASLVRIIPENPTGTTTHL